MFDEHNNNQTVNIKPACSGMLQKSHPRAYFKWFHRNSDFRSKVFDGNQRVLQVMVFGDENMLAEFLPQDDYDKWIKSEEEDNAK